jgi:3-methyladenine DNA glycosylase AlkC
MPTELKEWFNPDFYRDLAAALGEIEPSFDRKAFYAAAIVDLEKLELKERLRRTAVTCHRHLPQDFSKALQLLFEIAPLYEGEFTGMFCPDFVGLYGLDRVEESLEALKYFTVYSSSEFAVREFLIRDRKRTLAAMKRWSKDENHHVRRLSSEGTRPRLPWSFNLTEFIADPSLSKPILMNLRADESLYVRKSVANHLNDISKDHPEWMLDLVASWDRTDERTNWIIKRAARTLIKTGHPRAFPFLGFEARPGVQLGPLVLSQKRLRLGSVLSFHVSIRSTKKRAQKLSVDYVVQYVKKSGKPSPKVFKLTEIDLGPGEQIELNKRQLFKDFSTRKHYAGKHVIQIMVNGKPRAESTFDLIAGES